MDAGVVVDDNCIHQFKAFHVQNSPTRALIFSINAAGDLVNVEKAISKGSNCDTWSGLCENVLATEFAEKPCWVVYNLELVKEDQGVERQISKLVFLHWVPSKSKLKFKMLMSSTKQTLLTKLNCSMVNIEGTSLADVDESNVMDKLKSSI